MVLAALLLAMAVGCREENDNRDRPGGPLYEMWGAGGERIVVIRDTPGDEGEEEQDAEERSSEPLAKLRRRSDGYKVYDANFVPVGVVREREGPVEHGVDAESSALRPIRVESLEAGTRSVLRRKEVDIWGLEGRFRLERTARGWAVYDAESTWIGRFEFTGTKGKGEWRLYRGRNEESVWRVQSGAEGRSVEEAGVTRYRLKHGELDRSILLALALEELSLPDRVAIGLWLADVATTR